MPTEEDWAKPKLRPVDPQPTPTVNWGSGECVDVGTKLWDSWEDDALVANPKAPVCQTSGRRESAHALS
ncbi:hypothetical protein EN745_11870 [Mesorhizobium sp. M4A.F.Ca.ET.022.05.2.1]|nr:hypothetical protein EN745_11870 [Mesorhizobium sp. M4A.F.Ca.ET.022.05.2.1]TIV88142.1 MAG: hypothetical protein E5V78_07070 [Mesorhizobium sp.]